MISYVKTTRGSECEQHPAPQDCTATRYTDTRKASAGPAGSRSDALSSASSGAAERESREARARFGAREGGSAASRITSVGIHTMWTVGAQLRMDRRLGTWRSLRATPRRTMCTTDIASVTNTGRS